MTQKPHKVCQQVVKPYRGAIWPSIFPIGDDIYLLEMLLDMIFIYWRYLHKKILVNKKTIILN